MSLQSRERTSHPNAPGRVEVVDPFENPEADTPERLHETLFATRAGIMDVDTQLVSLLARRVQLARTLQSVSAGSADETRAVLPPSAAAEAARQGLPEEDVRALFARITKMSGETGEPSE